MLGILTLDTAFPRVRGDVGNPDTFAFPVRHATVRGALVDDVVHRRRDALLPAFVAAANELVDGGCIGIATTCGFHLDAGRPVHRADRRLLGSRSSGCR